MCADGRTNTKRRRKIVSWHTYINNRNTTCVTCHHYSDVKDNCIANIVYYSILRERNSDSNYLRIQKKLRKKLPSPKKPSNPPKNQFLYFESEVSSSRSLWVPSEGTTNKDRDIVNYRLNQPRGRCNENQKNL